MCCLFVANNLGATTRYRVFHQIEQLHHQGINATSAWEKRFGWLPDIFLTKLLYLHRLALTSRSIPLITLAKLRHIPIIFDSDDLVWDPREREYNFLDKHYPPEIVADLLKGTRLRYAMMRFADAFVFSTPYLAQRCALDFAQPCYVNQNALSQEQIAISAQARTERSKVRNDVVVGYFSGQAKVHDEDFALVAPALQAILDDYQHVRLRIYGGLNLPPVLKQVSYRDRIEQREAVDWRELPYHIANIDINIAPLVNNPQRRSKSSVKYLEAAAVTVPTVAMRLEPYQGIVHGKTGMLAGTNDEWRENISMLVEQTELRHQLGEAAQADVLAHHTTSVRAPQFARIIEQIISR